MKFYNQKENILVAEISMNSYRRYIKVFAENKQED